MFIPHCDNFYIIIFLLLFYYYIVILCGSVCFVYVIFTFFAFYNFTWNLLNNFWNEISLGFPCKNASCRNLVKVTSCWQFFFGLMRCFFNSTCNSLKAIESEASPAPRILTRWISAWAAFVYFFHCFFYLLLLCSVLHKALLQFYKLDFIHWFIYILTTR